MPTPRPATPVMVPRSTPRMRRERCSSSGGLTTIGVLRLLELLMRENQLLERAVMIRMQLAREFRMRAMPAAEPFCGKQLTGNARCFRRECDRSLLFLAGVAAARDIETGGEQRDT